MSTQDDIQSNKRSIGRLYDWKKEQEAVTKELEIAQAVLKNDNDNLKESLNNLIIVFDKFHGEFSSQTFKIVLWCVGMVFGIIGLIAVVWKAATDS